MNCSKCDKSFNSKAHVKRHELICTGTNVCSKCKRVIKTSYAKHVNSCDGYGTRRCVDRVKLGQGWIGGKTFDDVYGKERSDEIKNKIKDKATGISRQHTLETKNKMREGMLKRYEAGWEPKCGRALKLDYYSPIAGQIKVDGSWELAVAKYLDTANVTSAYARIG